MYFGFLNINKPVAMVSTKITNYTKYALRITVGHIGTYLHLEYYLLQLARQHS
jgi:tRNA U55 pseudouridine synthase TruB